MSDTIGFHLTGGTSFQAKVGDICWAPRGIGHHIQTIDGENSLRFAVTVPPVEHLGADRSEVCGRQA